MTMPDISNGEGNNSGEDTRSSKKRSFSTSSGQSAESYMSQLLTQPKRHRIGVDEDLSDDEEEPDNQIRHAGSIKKLTLKNFMCHDHFELSFGPHMNFIIGRNGSGKSAVLTGISVGLGAKATDTSRGSSTKQLIKDGKSIARIVVEIENDGLNAYEPEVYGKSIFVERKLTREGPNTYAIKSENGSIVSNKKKTLDDILQRFFIVVNNPLSFLSQDKAREFIGNSSDQTRFTCFSEGTNIQSILLNYQEASQNIHKLQNRSVVAKSYFKEASTRYLESERVYKKYKQSHTLRQQSEKIHGKIYWFNVEVMKKMIVKKELEISEKISEIKSNEQAIEDNEKLVASEKEELNTSQSEKNNIKEELGLRKEEFAQAESKFDESLTNVKRLRSDVKNYKSEVVEYKKKIENHKAELEKEQKKIDDANGGSKQAITERLEMLQGHREKLVSQRNDLQNKLNESEIVSPEMDALKREVQEISSTISNVRAKISSAEKAKNNRFAAFGANVSMLISDIEAASGWHRKPIGPVGCYVSVKEEYQKWGDLINANLQRALDSFVVCDEHDRRILNGLMRRRNINKSIIVRKFEQFNFNNQLSSRYRTMLNALEFQNEDAKFTLIDSSGIEEIVICETTQEAEETTRDHSVKQAFALNDRNSGTRVVRRDGQLSRDPVFYSRDLRKLAGKVDSESFTHDLNDLLRQESAIKAQIRTLQGEERERKLQLDRELSGLKSQMKKVNDSIFQAQSSLEQEGDYGRIANLNSQIDLCQNQIQTREGMSMEILENLDVQKRETQILKEKLEETRYLKTSVEDKLAECEAKINQHQEAIQILRGEIDNAKNTNRNINESIESLKQKIFEDNEKQKELVKLAQERCERSEISISESDTSKSITAEFRNIQQAIEDMERQNDRSFEEVQKDLLNGKALKDKCEKTLIELDNARIDLENDLNSRFENLNITIQEKLTRAKQSFESSLALRGFKGKLEFDFKNKRVIMEVQTEDNKETRAISSLSGGEKSFTQIAFLLSIWKIMKPRVCGLDEFDVFMDAVNRTIAIRLLIHELRGSVAQSIFITPQDIAVVGDLQDNEDVKIHKISAPRSD